MKSLLLDSIPQVTYGFGHREEPCPPQFSSLKESSPFQWKQVHGANIINHDSLNHTTGEADGFYTEKIGIPTKVHTADCVPILLARKDGGAVGALHAGWRGLLAGIIENFWHVTNESPANWVAVIGPSVRWCCYELGEDVINQFKERFPKTDKEIYVKNERFFDPSLLALSELQRCGVAEVENLEPCTYCSQAPTFYSHRRRTHQKLDEGRACQTSAIMRTN